MLVVLEGIDGSGKTTVSKLIKQQLEAVGKTVAQMDYPGYEKTKGGELVGAMLNGDYGDVDPKLAATLFALDRYELKPELEAKLLLHDVVIANRYATSNLAYQLCRDVFKEKNKELAKFIYALEFEVYKQPLPDVIINLKIPANYAVKNIVSKAKRSYTDSALDIYEQDIAYLSRVELFYEFSLVKLLPSDIEYYNLDTIRNGHLLAPEEIAKRVTKLLLDKNSKN